MRSLRILAKTLLLAELVYLLAANAFLNSGRLQRLINTDKQKIRIEFGLAWSMVPMLVHVRELRFWVQDDNIQFYFSLPEVTVAIDPVALSGKEFHALWVRGEALSFLFRLRRTAVEAAKLVEGQLATLPDVPTLLKPPPSPPDEAVPWRLRLSSVQIRSLKELWFERYRYVGPGSVAGGMSLYPSRGAEIFPAAVALDGGTVFLGQPPTATGVQARIEARIEPFEAEKVPGAEILRYTTARVQLKAQVSAIPIVEAYLARNPWLKIDSGTGTLESDVRVEKGVLRAPSFFRVQARALEARLAHHRVRGSAAIDWATIEERRHRFAVLFSDFELAHGSSGIGQIVGKGLRASLHSGNLSLLDSFEPFGLDLELPKARVTDLRYVNAYLPAGSRMRFDGGEGEVEGELHLVSSSDRDRGKFRVSARQARLNYGKGRLVGDADVALCIEKSDVGKGRLRLDGSTVELTRVQGEDREKFWWGKLLLPVGRLSLGRVRDARVEASLSAKDARPILDVLLGNELPGWVSGLIAFPDLLLRADLEADEHELRVTRLEGRGGANRLWGKLTVRGDEKTGRVLVKAGPLAAGVDFLGTESKLKLNDAYRWYFGKNGAEGKREVK